MKIYTYDRFLHYSDLWEYGCINIREAFFGGRTNNIKFIHIAKENETIEYKDVCSLYPFVLKNRIYPIGHATLIDENFDYSLQSYFGFVKCKVSPPKKLNLPVLPYKVNEKLLFPLCKMCANEFNQQSCEHSKCERMLIGTWTTAELMYALDRGYIIEDILQVLHFENTSEDLFKKYIDMWLKIKTENSGYPNWVSSESDRRKYIDQYFQKEGIELDESKIERNEALRFIAKIMLNSFWGKLAQRPNQPQAELINSYDKYVELASNPDRVIKSETMVNEDYLLTSWVNKEDSDGYLGSTNISVASYVTAWARLELLRIMEKIESIREGSVLYHDTDSVIYVQQENDEKISCGDYLGELTDEIPIGKKCRKYASLGPKIYAYELVDENGTSEVKMKVKGLSLTENVMKLIDMEKMMDMALKYAKHTSTNDCKKLKAEDVIEVKQLQFQIDSSHIISTREYLKAFKATSMKRRIVDVHKTLPYGYVDYE